MSNDTVFVKILDKEYQIACPPEEREALRQAAQNLDDRMRVIKSSGTVIGLERIAVMAALNLSYELQQASEQATKSTLDEDRLESLSQRITQALDQLD
ncbi:MAG: cell division protein ZapA [Candidatus Pelagadaptatus aseana]|uniref:cell division protein ZapA n=1 Tax=Candidatus Pelagadaptatus aseana TaxID=3120508 RepID=UPI0039B2EE69